MNSIDLKKLWKVTPELDNRSAQALLEAIKKNVPTEFDYLKYIHSVQTLQEMGLDTSTAFKSAYATSMTMGFSEEKFRSSIKFYENILASQREKFAEALKRQRAEKLTGQVEKNKQYEERIAQNKRKIEELTKEIELCQSKIDNSDRILLEEKEKLEKVTSNFVSSYEHFESKLKSDLNLFEEYIK